MEATANTAMPAEPPSRPSDPADHGPSHLVPARVLAAVFAALVLLTAVTVAATGLDLGSWNLTIALVIATAKGALVVLYFMHLRYDSPFHALVFAAALVFLALFLRLTLLDAGQYQPDVEQYRTAPAEGFYSVPPLS
jgi:cytochrome c oxidase subunit 4